jgi:peptide-methionine (S)-S-oxide reductase
VSDERIQRCTFSAGCFWGVEDIFMRLRGVKETKVGYTGGNFVNPTYEDVCSDTTGHAEAIEVKYDPNEISYEELLRRFWSIHDPTTKDRQGPDIGSQYRSAIFYHNPEQEAVARKVKKELNDLRFQNRIVTEIVPASTFYPAEDYHQKYYLKNGVESCNL